MRNIAEKARCNGSDSPVTSRGSSRATPWALAPLLSPEDHAPKRGRPLPPQPREGHPCPLRGLCTGQSQTAAATVLCLQGVFFSRAYLVSGYIRFSGTNKCHRFRSSLFPPITLNQARSHCSPGGGEPRGTQDAPPGPGSLFLPASRPCDPSPRPPSGSAGSTQTVPSSPGRGTSQEQAPGWKSFLWPLALAQGRFRSRSVEPALARGPLGRHPLGPSPRLTAEAAPPQPGDSGSHHFPACKAPRASRVPSPGVWPAVGRH